MRSTDVNSYGFCLWGTMKNMYVQKPHSMEEYQKDIRHEISAILVQRLRFVSKIYLHDVTHA
jgi:hypothetical protein